MTTVSKLVLLATFGAFALSGCGSQSSTPKAANATAATVTVPKPPAGDADANSSAFLAAAEPFENLTEQAPGAPRAKLAAMIADARKAADGVSPALTAPQKAAIETNFAGIDAGQKAGDRTAIALGAVEGYRTLVESARDTGKVPRAVSLLDYSGFRYQADLTARPVRWDDMIKVVAFARHQWSGIEGRIADKTLRADFAKSVTDMSVAVRARDRQAANTASSRELDLVDQLEGFFSK